MSKKATDIIAYITPIGLIIAFLAGDRENSKFHINQALVIWIAGILVNIINRVLKHIPLVGTIVGILCFVAGIFLLVCWIMGLVSAVQETERKVPILGEITLLK